MTNRSQSDRDKEEIVTDMLVAIGEDPLREGLKETPKRVVRAWKEWFSGYSVNPEKVMKTFKDGAHNVNEMVLLTDIPIISTCEHHMAPIIGHANVAYIPNGKIVGLSKIPRLVEVFSRRLQVQERLTVQIADCMMECLEPIGVAVIITAQHFCMSTRGVKLHGVNTTTSAMRGAFLDKPEARAEFLALIKK